MSKQQRDALDQLTRHAPARPRRARSGRSACQVTLEVTQGVPHVFQAFSAMLDEAGAALNSAGAFIRDRFAATGG